LAKYYLEHLGDIDIEGKFVDCLRKNFLIQHINTPTRVKGTDTPHVLDLVITDEYFIQNLIFESPLGKSDHSVITFDYNLIPGLNNNTNRNAKGNYESLRGSLHPLCFDPSRRLRLQRVGA